MNDIIWVQIEPNRSCNLHCKYCVRSIEPNDKKDMTLSTMNKVVNEISTLPRLSNVLIQGFGEPFIYPHLKEMVDLLKKNLENISIQIVTNGMVFNDSVISIIRSIDVLYVSIDSLSSEYWNDHRQGGDILKIINNLSSIKNANPNLSIILNTVVSNHNVNELDTLCKLCSEMQLSGIQLIPIYPVEINGDKYESLSKKVWKDLNLEITKLRSEYPTISLYSPFDMKNQDDCLWVNKGLYILYTGHVTPCCVMSSDDQIIYGDLNVYTLEDIMKSSVKEIFNKTTKNQDRCKECRGLDFFKIWNYHNPLPLIMEKGEI